MIRGLSSLVTIVYLSLERTGEAVKAADVLNGLLKRVNQSHHHSSADAGIHMTLAIREKIHRRGFCSARTYLESIFIVAQLSAG